MIDKQWLMRLLAGIGLVSILAGLRQCQRRGKSNGACADADPCAYRDAHHGIGRG